MVYSIKIYIGSDQEGVCGIATRAAGPSDVAMNKKLQTQEVVACCNAILDFDSSTEIVVNDNHGSGLNINIEDLPEQVQLIRQSPEMLDMMYGIDDSYDGFMFLAHAMRGVHKAVMCHVWEVQNLIVNGKALGEAGISSLIASYYGVPLILTSGDDAYEREVKDLSPTTETVVVKYGLGRYVARNLHPAVARKKIADGTKNALKRLVAGDIKPVELPKPPIKLEMQFADAGAADAACMMPGVQRIDGRTTLFVAQDAKTAYQAFYAQTRLQRGRLIRR